MKIQIMQTKEAACNIMNNESPAHNNIIDIYLLDTISFLNLGSGSQGCH